MYTYILGIRYFVWKINLLKVIICLRTFIICAYFINVCVCRFLHLLRKEASLLGAVALTHKIILGTLLLCFLFVLDIVFLLSFVQSPNF